MPRVYRSQGGLTESLDVDSRIVRSQEWTSTQGALPRSGPATLSLEHHELTGEHRLLLQQELLFFSQPGQSDFSLGEAFRQKAPLPLDHGQARLHLSQTLLTIAMALFQYLMDLFQLGVDRPPALALYGFV